MEMLRIIGIVLFAVAPLVFLGIAVFKRPYRFPPEERRPRSLRGPRDDVR